MAPIRLFRHRESVMKKITRLTLLLAAVLTLAGPANAEMISTGSVVGNGSEYAIVRDAFDPATMQSGDAVTFAVVSSEQWNAMQSAPTAGSKYPVSITIDKTGSPYTFVNYNVSAYIFSPVDKKIVTTVYPPDNWNFDAPLVPSAKIAVGTYDVIVAAVIKPLEDGYHATVVSHGVLEVKEGGGNAVTVKLSDAKNRLQVNYLAPDGQPFPSQEGVPASQQTGNTITSLRMRLFGMGLATMVNGSSRYCYITCDTDADAYMGGNAIYQSKIDSRQFLASYYLTGPFTEDTSATMSVDDYKSLDVKYEMTPSELSGTVNGQSMVLWMMNANNSADRLTKTRGRNDDPVYESVPTSIYMPEKKEPGSYYEALSLNIGARSVWDSSLKKGAIKYTGGIMVRDGIPYITPGKVNIVGGKATWWSPVDIYNIEAGQYDITNFSYSSYIAPSVYIWGTDKINSVEYTGRVEGPFNEYIAMDAPIFAKTLVEATYNGEKVETGSIAGRPMAGANLTLTFRHNDLLVNGTYATSAEAVVGLVGGMEDMVAPKMTGYQVRNEKGLITNSIVEGEDAYLYLSASDYFDASEPGSSVTLTLSVAPQDSEEWKDLPATVTVEAPIVGNLARASLKNAGLAKDTWYKVRATVTDLSGNYAVNTLNYCFQVTGQSSIDLIESDSENAEARFYNLNGVRVENPENGIYLRVTDSGRTEKVIVR